MARLNDRWFLGIDTSAYTTSVALVDGNGGLVADERRVLAVPPGRRGLRQSEAVFQHVRALPELVARLPAGWGRRVERVAVSVSPRPVAGSYMPVFVAGTSAARQIASALDVPFLALSHQEGHVWAGFWSAGTMESVADAPFFALHVSGGTTELLAGCYTGGGRLELERIGGTEDLTAGQMIDRVGVALGLPFPAGPGLETLAEKASRDDVRLPVSARGGRISFSGPTTAAMRALQEGIEAAQLAAAVQSCVARSLIALVDWARRERPHIRRLLAVGGVMANGTIRRRLADACEGWAIRCLFAAPRYSVDNGVGAALAALVAGSDGAAAATE